MKKGFLIAIVSLLLFAATTFGASVYVSSFKTTMYKGAGRGTGTVMILRKGYRLSVLSREGAWIKVQFLGKTGYVNRLFTSPHKPGRAVSILGSATKQARIHARNRASTDITAASARGLAEDQKAGKRSRLVNTRSEGFDIGVIAEMEKLYIGEEDLIQFLVDGGIRKASDK